MLLMLLPTRRRHDCEEQILDFAHAARRGSTPLVRRLDVVAAFLKTLSTLQQVGCEEAAQLVTAALLEVSPLLVRRQGLALESAQPVSSMVFSSEHGVFWSW